MPLPLWAIVVGIVLMIVAANVDFDARGKRAVNIIGLLLIVLGGLFLILDLVGYPRATRAVFAALQTAVDRPGAVPSNPMDANAIALIGVPVVALTQLAKWANLPDQWGPAAVLAFAALGIAVWVASYGGFHQADLFNYFVAWITTAVASAGVFGFTRAAASAVTATKPPPVGVAQNPTTP